MLRRTLITALFLLCIIGLFTFPLRAEEATQLINMNRRHPTFYGDSSTIHGDFLKRSSLCGDWGGMRNTLVDQGIYIDIGITQVYQWNVSGGNDIGDRYQGSGDLWINIDTHARRGRRKPER